MQTLKYDELSAAQRTLLDEAERALERSYNPYSRFSVGAALRGAQCTVAPRERSLERHAHAHATEGGRDAAEGLPQASGFPGPSTGAKRRRLLRLQ